MRYKPLPIGVDNFESLITDGYYFVDKTLFIKDLIDIKSTVTLFTRPRRFGKTLNLSMLQYFFEDDRKTNGEKIDHSFLFEGLDIMKSDKKYLSYMGQYPVINLSLKSGKKASFSDAYEALKYEIAKEYTRHYFICESDKFYPGEKELYIQIMERKAKMSDYHQSLQFLSYCLHHFTTLSMITK